MFQKDIFSRLTWNLVEDVRGGLLFGFVKKFENFYQLRKSIAEMHGAGDISSKNKSNLVRQLLSI